MNSIIGNDSQNLKEDFEPVEITSNYLCDYAVGSIIKPEDKNGSSFPFVFKVQGPNSVYVEFADLGSDKYDERTMYYQLYIFLFASLLEKRANEIGDVKYVDLSERWEVFTLTYSTVLNVPTFDEAVEKSIKLMDEFREQLEQAMVKVENLLKNELNIN